MTHLLVRRMGQTIRVVCVGLPFLGPKTVPNMSVYRSDSLFQEQLGVQRSNPCKSYQSND